MSDDFTDELACEELTRIHAKKALTKKTLPLRRSRLDLYGFEILQLYKNGASLRDIQIWLSERHIRVHRSTIKRWLDKRMAEA